MATAVGTVIQRGHKIIIIKVETFNNEGTLLTEMLGTMYVIGKFETIPENGKFLWEELFIMKKFFRIIRFFIIFAIVLVIAVVLSNTIYSIVLN